MQFLWKRFYVELLLLLTTTVKISEVSHTFLCYPLISVQVCYFIQTMILIIILRFLMDYSIKCKLRSTVQNCTIQWRIQGRDLGGWPPLTFRPNGGPKGEKRFFGDHPSRSPSPPPLSQGLDDRAPLYLKVWIRHCHCIISLRSPNMYIFLQGLMMRTNLRGEVGENLW